MGAGALVFSRKTPDLIWGMSRCISSLGALPERIVWDRERAISTPRGEPTEALLFFCGQLPVGWQILKSRDPQSKGLLERLHRYMRTNFETARTFNSPEHFQTELDAWMAGVARRRHQTLKQRPIDRFEDEVKAMRPLPCEIPDGSSRFTVRVLPQPYLRFETCDYSLDPRAVGRRVEITVDQRRLLARVLDSGEIAADHARTFAREVTITDPTHQELLEALRGRRRLR